MGIVVAYWFDFGMSFVGGPIAWRLPVALQAAIAVGVIFLVFALPESPRWLFHHGRNEEAIEALCRFHGMSREAEFITTEKQAILHALETEAVASKTLFSVFKHDQLRTGYRIFLAWFIQMMNQVCGINLVVYYIPSVLRLNVGMGAQLSQILGGCIQMMFVVGSILPTFALDRMGRRKTMMTGLGGLAFCMLMVAALLSQADGGATARGTAFASASVTFFFLYMLIFGAT